MKSLKVRGNKISFEDLNPEKDDAILLVHGHPFNHTMWKYQYATLQDYRLILPDLIGYGESDCHFDKIYIETQALDLSILLDQLNIKQVHLIGLSMGGQIIVEFQRLFPARVKSLIICASIPNSETSESHQNRLLLAETINKIGMTEYTENHIHKYINLDLIEIGSPVYSHLFQMMSETKKEGAVASHKGRAERRDNSNYLNEIKIPTLIIAGEKDFFFTVDDVKSVAEKIKQSECKIIMNSGHLPNMEKPVEFNSIINEFYIKLRKKKL